MRKIALLFVLLPTLSFGQGVVVSPPRPPAWRVVGSTGQPAFGDTWVNYHVAYQSAAFYKDASGIVHVIGVVKSGHLSQPIFTLPVGYRPSKNFMLAVGANDAYGEIYVHSDGTITLEGGSVGAWVSLGHITFLAEQ